MYIIIIIIKKKKSDQSVICLYFACIEYIMYVALILSMMNTSTVCGVCVYSFIGHRIGLNASGKVVSSSLSNKR